MMEQLTMDITEKFLCYGCLRDHPVENKQIAVDNLEYCPFCCDIVNKEYGTSRKPRSLATRHTKEQRSTTILRKSIPRRKKKGNQA